MTQYYDFKMNYKLTVDLENGTSIEREFDSYNAFRLMYNLLVSRWGECSNQLFDFSGSAMVRPNCIVDMKAEYVEYPLEA